MIVDTDTDFTSGATLFAAASYNPGTEVVTFNGIDLDDADFFALGTAPPGGNTAPTLLDTSVTLASVHEDAGAPVGAVGTLISAMADLNPPAGGQDNVTDPDGDGVANPDPFCLHSHKIREAAYLSFCGLGIELVLLLSPLMWFTWRRRRSLP